MNKTSLPKETGTAYVTVQYDDGTVVRGTKKMIGDLVSVVRCRDCRYSYLWIEIRKNGIPDTWVECRNPNGLNRDVPEDGYCYCGERKYDGNN